MLLKSSQHNPEPIVSAPSVVILTCPAGLPTSAPVIVRTTAVDSYRVSISWEPGPFSNGPILSYVLRLQGAEHKMLKVHATPEPYTNMRQSDSDTHTEVSLAYFCMHKPFFLLSQLMHSYIFVYSRKTRSHAFLYYLTIVYLEM